MSEKKYKRYYNILSKISLSTGTDLFILSSSAISASLTGVGIAIGASIGGVGLICGIASVITGSSAKKVSKKVIKHEKTLAICESKVNSIKDRISKALGDNKISDEEFSSILSEVEKYSELQRAIRVKYRRNKEANEAYVEDLKKKDSFRADGKTESRQSLNFSCQTQCFIDCSCFYGGRSRERSLERSLEQGCEQSRGQENEYIGPPPYIPNISNFVVSNIFMLHYSDWVCTAVMSK